MIGPDHRILRLSCPLDVDYNSAAGLVCNFRGSLNGDPIRGFTQAPTLCAIFAVVAGVVSRAVYNASDDVSGKSADRFFQILQECGTSRWVASNPSKLLLLCADLRRVERTRDPV